MDTPPTQAVQIPAYVPCMLLETMGYVESNWKQFAADYGDCGYTYIYDSCDYGVMQVVTGMGGGEGFDPERTAGEYTYNIGTGAKILSDKWNEQDFYVGDNDPHVVEDWYYAVWAYNSWSWWNNPNRNCPLNNPDCGTAWYPNREPYDGTQPPGWYPYQELVWGRAAHPPGPEFWEPLSLALPDRVEVGGGPTEPPAAHLARPEPHHYSCGVVYLPVLMKGYAPPRNVWVFDTSSPNGARVSYDNGQTFGPKVSLGGTEAAANAAHPADRDVAWYVTTAKQLWKTTDAGVTFAQTASFPSLNEATDVLVAPGDPDRVYVVGKPKVYKSTDGGLTWSSGVSLPGDVNLVRRGAVHPSNSDILVVGGSVHDSDSEVVWRSTDGGTTWSQEWRGGGDWTRVESVTVCRANGNVWYASLWTDIDSYRGVLKSTDGGDTWVYKAISGLSSGQVWDVAVDRSDCNGVVALTRDSVRRSTDGGDTWAKSLDCDPHDGWRLRADPAVGGAFWLVGRNVGDEGWDGLFESVDGGATWERVYSGAFLSDWGVLDLN